MQRQHLRAAGYEFRRRRKSFHQFRPERGYCQAGGLFLPDAKIVVAGDQRWEEVALLIARLDSLQHSDPSFHQEKQAISSLKKRLPLFYLYDCYPTGWKNPDSGRNPAKLFFSTHLVLRLLQNGQPNPILGLRSLQLDEHTTWTILVLPDHKILLGGEVSERAATQKRV